MTSLLAKLAVVSQAFAEKVESDFRRLFYFAVSHNSLQLSVKCDQVAHSLTLLTPDSIVASFVVACYVCAS